MHIDDKKQKAFCSSCGAENLITRDVVHSTTNYNTTQNIHKTIIGSDKAEAAEYIHKGQVFVTLGEYAKAKAAFEKAVDEEPADFRGWLGLAAVLTKNFTDFADIKHREFLQKALKVADNSQKIEIENIYAPYEIRVNFEIEDGILRKYKGKSAEVIIPDSILKIGGGSFAGNKTLKSVIIPDGVIRIGAMAFDSCSRLASITIPATVKKIRSGAFAFCENLTKLELPDGLAEIETSAFSFCNGIERILIPDSVTKMEEYVFEGWEKEQTIYVRKQNSQLWDKHWHKGCKAKIIYR
jgi:tetratricopeptide (TPR) repeat protein